MNGLLDWLETPQGTGLLSAAASYAANARRGTPVNNIGRGLAGGLAGYQSAQQGIVDAERQQQEQEYRKAMMQAQMMNAQTAAKNAEIKAAKAKADAEAEAGMFERVFNLPVQLQKVSDEEYDFIPAGYQSDFIDIKDAKEVKPPPQFQVNDQMAKVYGFEPNDLPYLAALYESDKKEFFKEARAIRAANRKGRTEAKDVLAKERAMAEAMGVPLSQYLKDKTSRSGVNVNVAYGQPMAATDANGNPVFIRPPMKVNEPPVVMPGFTPPEKPTEAEAKSATFHQQMNAAKNEIEDIEKSIDVSSMLKQADIAMAGGLTNPLSSAPAQRYRQAQEQWAEAFLRIKTGAAATQDEVNRNIRTFFPQIGDSAAVIEQKRRMREKAEQDVKAMGGTATRRIERQQTAPQSAKPAAKPEVDAESFNMLPNAKQYDGRTMTDSKTGKKYKSVNGKWVEAK